MPVPFRKGVAVQVVLTPNQERALRIAVRSAEDPNTRGLYVSGRFGSVVVRRPERAALPPATASAVEMVRRGPPPHAPWRTPTPAALAVLVRG